MSKPTSLAADADLHRPLRRAARGAFRLFALSAGAGVFVALAYQLWRSSTIPIDIPIQRALIAIRGEVLTAAFGAVTHLGDTDVITAVTAIVVVIAGAKRHYRSAIYMAATAAGAGILTVTLKEVFARARPEQMLLAKAGFAFPSGHSLLSAATFGAIAILVSTRAPAMRRWAIAACVSIVAAVGTSRAYLFVHFPSDVLAGWALGITWALWLKPLAIGRGFKPTTTPNQELEADHFDPVELEAEEQAHERAHSHPI